MIDITLSILFSTSILVFFRLLKPAAGATLQVITINYFVASLLGLATAGNAVAGGLMRWPGWMPVALVLGFIFIGTFFLFALSSRQAGVALTAVASRMSVLIPVLGGVLLFGESGGVSRWIGVVLVFPAFYYTLYNKDKNGRLSPKHAILPFALLLGTGMNDLLMNYATRKFYPVDLSFMLAIIFSIAFIIGFIILLFSILKHRNPFRVTLLPHGILLGVINYASTFFLLRSMNQFDATLLFPVVNASIVVLASIIDIIFFAHRPNRWQITGIVLSLIAIVLITRG